MKKSSFILEEGYRKIAIVFIASIFLLLLISDCLGYLGLLIGLFLVYVYRNSYRHLFKNSQSVLAPIDSTIVAIDHLNDKCKIYCKVSLCNNHIFRAPSDGDVKVKKYKRGLNLNPNSYKASLYNEQTTLKFPDMKIKLVSGLFNHKMKRIKENNVLQGDPIAVFLDGMVVITISNEHDTMVNIGDKLTAGQTILFTK